MEILWTSSSCDSHMWFMWICFPGLNISHGMTYQKSGAVIWDMATCCVFPEPKPGRVKQRLVALRLTCGTKPTVCRNCSFKSGLKCLFSEFHALLKCHFITIILLLSIINYCNFSCFLSFRYSCCLWCSLCVFAFKRHIHQPGECSDKMTRGKGNEAEEAVARRCEDVAQTG